MTSGDVRGDNVASADAGGGVVMGARPLDERMAWDRLIPPERAGDVAQRLPLVVGPLLRLDVDELLVVDDDLPQADGATLFWIDAQPPGWEAWAARIDGPVATPWLVRARTLRLVAPDPALVDLIGSLPAPSAAREPDALRMEGLPRDLEPMPRALVCICREKTVDALYRSVDARWRTVEEVKRRTGAAFGECQGRRCVPLLARRLDQDAGDRGAEITPRPPLVPVPASVLAAFAEIGEPA